MEKLPVTLDLDALRSFVIGIECGSFAQAASRLCRSTSAVSAQLKKLEQQCATVLVVKKGRHLELTSQGQILLGYARRLLALNDEAQLALKSEQLQGEIRIGLQEDFGESLMPGILGDFKRHNPEMRVIARIDRNQALFQALNDNSLDMALVWQQENRLNRSKLMAQFPLQWLCPPALDIHALLAQNKPLPLVMFDHPCLMRSRAIDALDRAGIPWQVVFVSHSLSGIWSALQAGLGITLRTRIGLPGNLSVVNDILPDAGNLGVCLEQNSENIASQPARIVLEQLIKEALLKAG